MVFCGTLGGSAGPLMAGYVFDLTGNYRAAFSLMAAMAFTALVLITFLRQNRAASPIVS
ncbi:MAG: MFS transporter [Desulfobacteraceae bacterium]